MAISANDVKVLREKTGAGMMDCKKALEESGGDAERAITYLREKGIAKAASKVGRAAKEGIIYAYIHPGDKLGVMLEINCETDFVARTDEFRNFVKDVAMHIAASNPVAISREEIDPALVESERQIYRTQAINEGKPEKILDKIVDGKLDKFYAESCLLEQGFVKDPDQTITQLLTGLVAKLGENILIKRFVRFRLGE
ncbi:MAG: translation elongation factor Ts [candidate division Zixibacteria bacterium]|nr:translation elongation factor Ts [candidate division Zixibacteria bacterium]